MTFKTFKFKTILTKPVKAHKIKTLNRKISFRVSKTNKY